MKFFNSLKKQRGKKTNCKVWKQDKDWGTLMFMAVPTWQALLLAAPSTPYTPSCMVNVEYGTLCVTLGTEYLNNNKGRRERDAGS